MKLCFDKSFLNKSSVYVKPYNVDPAVLLEAISICEEHNGVGIAAPQIGVHQRWAYINLPDKRYFIFNPEIRRVFGEKRINIEGCLSIQGEYHYVPRYDKIGVKYQELNGRWRIRLLTGLEAHVFQHELEHLNGRLISDRSFDE